MSPPVLWHIRISPFNEKARWALDYKGIAHTRRAPLPGIVHPLRAYAMTRSITFPVLQIDGRAIGDSSRIVEELERRRPEPPLYPADPGERARALELEAWFDELGHEVRRVGFDEALREGDPDKFALALGRDLPGAVKPAVRLGLPAFSAMLRLRYGIRRDRAAAAMGRVEEGIERIEAELGGRDHLVGDSFSVADLTAAAMLAPIFRPPQFPYPLPEPPPQTARWLAGLRDRPGIEWVFATYERHRPPSAELPG